MHHATIWRSCPTTARWRIWKWGCNEKELGLLKEGTLFLARFLVRNKVHDPSVGPFVNRRPKQERAFGLWWREVATLPNEETTKGRRRDVRWLKLTSILVSCELWELKPFFFKEFCRISDSSLDSEFETEIQTTMYNVRRCRCLVLSVEAYSEVRRFNWTPQLTVKSPWYLE